MASLAGRIHRLPQRLDYTLIPAPLDLSLPLATEKSPLPAIIVTPSSPSIVAATDSPFFIAFLAPPPKPSFRERIQSLTGPLRFKARTTIFLILLVTLMILHVLTLRFSDLRPHLEFDALSGGSAPGRTLGIGLHFGKPFWGTSAPEESRDLAISEPSVA